jgi:D-beta-D-heptose 7-phosphate kinase/D-beta-D-heptose 1-phosphate adenosyltransferase
MSVRRLKGEDPVQNEKARSDILASLEFVDIIVIFQDDTPIRLFDALRPHVLIKGANYAPEEVVGAELVKSYGGTIVLAEIKDVHTTNSKIAQMTKGTL